MTNIYEVIAEAVATFIVVCLGIVFFIGTATFIKAVYESHWKK